MGTYSFLARRFDDGEAVRVTIAGRTIASVEAADVDGADVDGAGSLPIVAPGFFDLQINGWGGTWFSKNGLTEAEIAGVLEEFPRHGVTRLFPTLITNSFEVLRDGFAAIAAACDRDPRIADMIPGCHLEGPYISPEDGPRGAHPLVHVRPADWEEFERLQETAGGRIRLVTLAPEVPGAIGFIRQAVKSGVVISIGHTAAKPEEIRAAADTGATLSTHFGNGAHATLPRHPNYLWEQLADERLAASIICDGFHLPASVVRCVLRCKPPGRVILTCDASGDAGRPPGLYRNGANEFEVLEDGRIVVAGQRIFLAGSGAATDACIAGVMRMAGVSLCDAVQMATTAPAQLVGIEEIHLQPGARADLVLLRRSKNDNLSIAATLVAGELRYDHLDESGVGRCLVPDAADAASAP